MFDDFKDFLVMHYMGDRTDTEFWRYISSGATKTDYIDNLLETLKIRLPNVNDFPKYYGAAGWPLYSFVMEGLNLVNKNIARNELNFNAPNIGPIYEAVEENYLQTQQFWHETYSKFATWEEMITHFRILRKNYVNS